MNATSFVLVILVKYVLVDVIFSSESKDKIA